MQRNKINHLIIILFLFLVSCPQQQNKGQEEEVQIIIKEVDTTAPVLQRIEPEDNVTLNNISSINISGIFSDASEIVEMTIDGRKVSFSLIANENNLNVYGFSVNVDLKIGLNSFLLKIKDKDGNIFEKRFSYTREDTQLDKELVIKLEKNEVPLAGNTFVEVLYDEEGKQLPVSSEELVLKAQQGYFSGLEYHAPPYGGVDIITATSKEKKAKGKIYIKIHSPRLKHSFTGPENIQIGKTGTFTIQAENVGDMNAVDARVVIKLPDFLIVKNYSNGGKFIPVANEIQWTLGSLTSGVSKNVNFTVEGIDSDNGKIIASVLSSKEEISKTAYPIKVTGEVAIDHFCRPSIAEIEKKITTHVKLVANEDIQNLKLDYTFPDECVFIDAKVESELDAKIGFANTGKTIQFSTISSLEKGKSVTFMVTFLVQRYGQITNSAKISLISNRGKTVITEDVLTVPTLD